MNNISAAKDSFELSTKISDADFVKNLEELDDVHCPCCGNKMMSREKYEKLMEKAGKINNPEDYCELLEENKAYLSNSNKPILDIAKQLNKTNPDMSYENFLREIRTAGINVVSERIDSVNDYLNQKLELEIFTPEDNLRINKCIKNLQNIKTTTPKYYQYKDIRAVIDENLGNLECFDFDKDEIYNHVKNELKSSILLQNSVRIQGLKYCTNEENSKVAFLKLFKTAMSNVTNISNHEKFADDLNNKILICGNCSSYRENRQTYYLNTADFQQLGANFNIYLEDIVQNMGSNKLHGNAGYIIKSANIVNNISNHRISIPKENLLDKMEHVNFVRQRPDFLPMLLEEDIPCSCCGTVMVNHTRKREIGIQLQQAKTPKDLYEIVKKNAKYINPLFKEYTTLMQNLIEENPEISENDMMTEIQIKASNNIRKHLKEIISEVRKKSNSDIGTQKERDGLKVFANTLEKNYINYCQTKNFNYSDYRNLIGKTCLYITNNPFKLKELTQTEFKKIVAINNLAFPFDDITQKNKSELKAYLESVFRMSGFTIDHFIPQARKGDSKIDNLLGMCKICNATKSNESPKEWVKIETQEKKENMRKNLEIMDKLAREGKLPGYEDYAADIAYNVNRITHSIIDLRTEFSRKKKNRQ